MSPAVRFSNTLSTKERTVRTLLGGAFPVADTDLIRGPSYRYGVGRFMLFGICTLLHTCSGQNAGLQQVA
jgi:hypothetical protein